MKIYLIVKYKNERILNLIKKLNLIHDENSSIALIINFDSLELHNRNKPCQKPIKIDFNSKKNIYRCYKFNKKNEVLAKVIGIKNNFFPFVLDITAGFGRDAFILAFLGCRVIMVENHPIVTALLQDGLTRGYENKKIGFWLQNRLSLIFDNSINMLLLPIMQPDVIYIDPMYPMLKKSSLPKKDMQFLRLLINTDDNSDELLQRAKILAKKRIVVKRPCYAKSLSDEKVDFIIKSKNHRFDIYNPV